MQNFMRKHKKLIMWFIIIAIGVPMGIFFGLPQGGPANETSTGVNIMEIGGVPVTEAEFINGLRSAANRGNQTLTYEELDKNGTAQRILDQLIDSALLRVRERQRGFDVNQSVLQDLMKDWDQFQNAQGEFDPRIWNQWVAEYGGNWDDLYAQIREGVSRQVMLDTVWAKAGRVTDSDIREEVVDDFTSLQVKYAKIAPETSVSREQVEAYFEENRENYRELDKKRAQFVVIPYLADVPPLALDLAQRARAGDDFAKLADEFSDFDTRNGGEMGWLNPETASPVRKPALDLAIGEVSEPVASSDGYYVYKVENERFVDADGNVIGGEAVTEPEAVEGDAAETPEAPVAADPAEGSGTREVFARQIFIRSQLDDAGRQAKADLGEQIAVRAAELHEIAKEAQALAAPETNWTTQAANVATHAAELAALAGAQAAAAEGDAAATFASIQESASAIESNVDTSGQPGPVRDQAVQLMDLAKQASALLENDETTRAQADEIARWADVTRRGAAHVAARLEGDASEIDLSGIREAAEEAGVAVQTTESFFDNQSAEIEGVAPLDVTEFRQALSGEEETVAPYNVIRARENVYVASVVEVVPGEIPPLDDIYAKVEEATLADYKRGDEYKDQVTEIIDQIKAAGISLDQVGNQFPTLQEYEVTTSEPFNRSDDFWVADQVYISSRQIFELVGHAEPGTVAGPVNYAIGGDLYVVELVSATPPTDEELAAKEDVFKAKKDQKIAQRQNQLLADYLVDLRENLLPTIDQSFNAAAINRILGRDDNAPVKLDADDAASAGQTLELAG